MMGPPTVPPNWLKRNSGLGSPVMGLSGFPPGTWLTKYGVASKLSLRKNHQALPCKLLVPDLVTRLVMEPALLPYWAELFRVSCWNSWTVSSMGVLTLPPLRPLLET